MPDPLAMLRQDTGLALATEVMGWSISADGFFWLGPVDEEGYAAEMYLVANWWPTQDWSPLGTVLDKVTGPSGFIAIVRFGREGDGYLGEVVTKDGQVCRGYGESATEAVANAVLKAAKKRTVGKDG